MFIPFGVKIADQMVPARLNVSNETKFARRWLMLTRSSPKDPRDYYKNFIFSWLALIFLAKAKHQQGEEKSLVNSLLSISGISKEEFIGSEQEKISELNKLRVKNDRYGDTIAADKLSDALNRNDVDEIWDNLLEVLYVVRCNLFHGDKVWKRARDDQIMKVSSKLVLDYTKAIFDAAN